MLRGCFHLFYFGSECFDGREVWFDDVSDIVGDCIGHGMTGVSCCVLPDFGIYINKEQTEVDPRFVSARFVIPCIACIIEQAGAFDVEISLSHYGFFGDGIVASFSIVLTFLHSIKQ